MDRSKDFRLVAILEKMENRDKDYRYMACSDLANELVKDSFTCSADEQHKMCAALIKLLNDSASEVQGVAVKCLAPLVKKVETKELVVLADDLCTNMLDSNDQKREISGLGMKTLLSGMADSQKDCIKKIAPKILGGIEGDFAPQIKAELLETLNTCLSRFGSAIPEHHGRIESVLLAQITTGNATARKRGIQCIASLAQSCNDDVFASLVSAVSAGMTSANGGIYVQVIGGISRTVGFRLGPYVEKIVPVLLQQLDAPAEGDESGVMKESCLQSIESLVIRCPKEITPLVDAALDKSLLLLKYNPDMDAEFLEEQEGADDMSESEEEEDEDDEDDEEREGEVPTIKCVIVVISFAFVLIPA